MPAERVSMRRVREILRLKHACGSSDRAIARSLGIARSTVALTLERPAAIDTQNWRRSSRRATEGRPGDRNAPRRHRSERRLRGSTATSLVEVLRRPLEPALYAGTGTRQGLRRKG